MTGIVNVDRLIPDAPWFWRSVCRWCEPACCGLDAFDFSHQSVRWACGDDVGPLPAHESEWRDDQPGEPLALAAELRVAAASIRRVDGGLADSTFLHYRAPVETFAEFLEDLATKLEKL
jgi:hypothetical protein